MITLDQIKELDLKVKKAVEVISRLRHENRTLKNRLEENELRIIELEEMINSFKQDQSEIEQGIQKAIEELNSLEGDASDSQRQNSHQAAYAQPVHEEKESANLDLSEEPGLEEQEPEAELDIF